MSGGSNPIETKIFDRPEWADRIFGAPAGIRTPDTLPQRQVLCRLSHWGVSCFEGGSIRNGEAVAGAAGLEPANGGVKVRCVTASPRPYVVARLTVSRPRKAGTLGAFAGSSFSPATRCAGLAAEGPGSHGSRFRVPAKRDVWKNGGIGMFPNPAICGVGKGTRTLDTRNHNPVL